MSLFSSRELNGLQCLDESAMSDRVTLIAITIGTDAGGAQTQTTRSTSALGRFRKRSGRELAGDQLKERGAYELHLPRDTDVAEVDRVRVGAREYRIVWRPNLADYDTALTLGLEDV